MAICEVEDARLPGSLGVEEEDEECVRVVLALRSQHLVGRHRDRHAVVEIPRLRHLRVDYLQCVTVGIIHPKTLYR